MKIRVIHDFYDKENDLKLRSVGDTLTVSKDRAEYLVRMKIAEVIDSKGGDPESPIEAQGHRVINCFCETHVKLYSCRQHIKNCKGVCRNV